MLLAVLNVSETACSHAALFLPRRQVVRFGDLNLTSPEGTQVLYKRIEHAAGYVRGEQNVRDLAFGRRLAAASYSPNLAVRQGRDCYPVSGIGMSIEVGNGRLVC